MTAFCASRREVKQFLDVRYLPDIIIKMFFFSSRSYHFKLDEVESFRYRAKDAWRSVTKIAIREARLKEIRQEAFNSKQLKVIIILYIIFKSIFEFFVELL